MDAQSQLVSFRHSEDDMAEAEKICLRNNTDLSGYIVSALIHYVYAKVSDGVIPAPDFMHLPPCPYEARGRRPDDEEYGN